jgi:uncharacterized OB-fold protein
VVTTALPPKPVADRDTQPFWDGVSEHRLLVQKCRECARWIWQPRPICPWCHGEDPEWREVSGDARVVSWTVLHPPVLTVWQDKLPFVLVLVELDDAPGARMIGQLVDDAGELLQTDGTTEGIDFDVAVSLRWRVDEAGQTLPAWTIA